MTAPRILVTGAAGSIGRRVVRSLARHHHVVAVDLRDVDLPVRVRLLDVRDPWLGRVVATEGITHVVHLAAVLDRTVDPDLARSIDVDGTRNVLVAAVDGGAAHLTVASSGSAYGHHADNPVPLVESDPLRGNETLPYSHHKRLVEELLADARQEHPGLAQLVLRICTVLGTDVHSPVTDLLTRPILPAVTGGSANDFVFVWDDDLVDVLVRGVTRGHVGIFNVAGSGWVTPAQVARAMGTRAVPVPAAVLRAGFAAGQRLGAGSVAPDAVTFLAHRPVLANDALVAAFGPLAHTSADALAAFAAARGTQ